MDKKLNNLFSFSDFEKNWKPEEHKKTKRTETGLDILKEELSPEAYDSVIKAGERRKDLRGKRLSNTAAELKFRNVLGKHIKLKSYESETFTCVIMGVPTWDGVLLTIPIKKLSENIPIVYLNYIPSSSRLFMSSGVNAPVPPVDSLSTTPTHLYIDRFGSKIISEIGKLVGVEIDSRRIPQI